MSMRVWNPFREMEDLLERYTDTTGRSARSGNDFGMALLTD